MVSDKSYRLEEFAASARRLDLAEFSVRHGKGFLVRSTADGELIRPKIETPLEDWRRAATDFFVTIASDPLARKGMTERPETEEFFVHPVRKRDRDSVAPISVGRSATNDVCIEDVSVSKHHADLVPGDDGGRLQVTDRGSKNGCLIGKERIAPNTPRDVPPGGIVAFGGVRFVYMPVAQFIDFVRGSSISSAGEDPDRG